MCVCMFRVLCRFLFQFQCLPCILPVLPSSHAKTPRLHQENSQTRTTSTQVRSLVEVQKSIFWAVKSSFWSSYLTFGESPNWRLMTCLTCLMIGSNCFSYSSLEQNQDSSSHASNCGVSAQLQLSKQI